METQDISEADTLRVAVIATDDPQTAKPLPVVQAQTPHSQFISIERLFLE